MLESTTRLKVWITDYTEGEEENIESIINENGFRIHSSHKPSDDGIEFLSYGFGRTDDNLSLVQDMKEKFESEFPNKNVTLSNQSPTRQNSAIDFCERIGIEPTSESAESDGEDDSADKQRDSIDYRTNNSEEVSDGHSRLTSPVEDGEPGDEPEWRAFDSRSRETESETVESTEGETDERDTRDGSPIEKEELTTTIDWKDQDLDQTKGAEAKRGDGWSAWYPCPECGSTKLLERIEQVLTVTVNNEGEIIKEMSDGEELYFKCASCGEKLLNEW